MHRRCAPRLSTPRDSDGEPHVSIPGKQDDVVLVISLPQHPPDDLPVGSTAAHADVGESALGRERVRNDGLAGATIDECAVRAEPFDPDGEAAVSFDELPDVFAEPHGFRYSRFSMSTSPASCAITSAAFSTSRRGAFRERSRTTASPVSPACTRAAVTTARRAVPPPVSCAFSAALRRMLVS